MQANDAAHCTPVRAWRPAALLLVALATTFLAGCQSWEATRTDRVVPLRDLLHVWLPQAMAAGDAARIAGFFHAHAPGEEPAEVLASLAGFDAIEQATCRIDSVEDLGDGRVLAATLIELRGTDRFGRRLATAQPAWFDCANTGAGWKIASITPGERSEIAASGPTFREEAVRRGILHEQRSRGVRDAWGMFQEYLPGSGLSVRDVDDNGVDDVLLVSGGDVRLLLNEGDGTFADATERYGLETPEEGECRFGIFSDIDNDGDGDLFLGVVDGPSYLYHFEDGRYRRVLADSRGIVSSRQATSACFADFDGDGDLDLYVTNGGNLLRESPEPIYNARNGTPNQLFLNRGDGTFEDATERAGVGDAGWGLACTTVDYDRDGDVDLFVANDFGLDVLYANRGDATFEDVTRAAGLGYRGSSMGASFGDVDGNGYPDLFVSGMASGSRWIVDQPGFPIPAMWPLSMFLGSHILDIMKEMLHGNRLYLARGDGTFAEVSSESATRFSGWAWGGIFLDYDNDGREDLYVLNGFLSGFEKDDL